MPIPTGVFDTLVVQSLDETRRSIRLVVGFDDLGLGRVNAPCWLAGRNGRRAQRIRRTAGTGPGVVSRRPAEPAKDADLRGGHRTSDHLRVLERGPLDLRARHQRQPQVSLRRNPTRSFGSIARAATSGRCFGRRRANGISSIALSPDGRTLSIVTRLDRNRRALLVMPAAGGTPRQVHEFRQPTGGGVDHVWSADGRSILWVEGPEKGISSLRSVRPDVQGAAPETDFQWTGQFFGLRFHPNGRTLAFTGRLYRTRTSSEVWVIENLEAELKTARAVRKAAVTARTVVR